jgi:hypothetical protein
MVKVVVALRGTELILAGGHLGAADHAQPTGDPYPVFDRLAFLPPLLLVLVPVEAPVVTKLLLVSVQRFVAVNAATTVGDGGANLKVGRIGRESGWVQWWAALQTAPGAIGLDGG